jgi:hypothetical protein
MAKTKSSTKAKARNNSNNVSKGAVGAMCGLVALIIIIIIVLIILAFVPKKREVDIIVKPPHKPSCNSNEDCVDQMCGKPPRMGCCAVCDAGGDCQQGMLTAKGCTVDAGNGNENGEKNNNGHMKKEQPFGMGNTQDKPKSNNPQYYDASANQACYQNNVGSASNTFGTSPCTSDEDCYLKNCTGYNSYEGCGSVCQSGMCWSGPNKEGAGVQTKIPFAAFPGYSSSYPNTWVISSSGKIYGATMGSCTVAPTGSSLQNHVGFFESCQPNAPSPSYVGYNERYNAYAPGFSACN